jgi:hypothetical protein
VPPEVERGIGGAAVALCRVMTPVLTRFGRLAWVLPMLLSATLAGAQDGQVVFSEKSELGQLWANLSLSYLRLEEPFLPMVVGVQNLSQQTMRLDRSSFRLIGPDGRRYPMAELKTVRGSYGKFSLDRRIASANGIPADLWARQRNLRESNFFPDVGLSRRPTVIDHVTLARRDGMVDLVYFETPAGLAAGVPFVLEVVPTDGPAPLRLRLMLGSSSPASAPAQNR